MCYDDVLYKFAFYLRRPTYLQIVNNIDRFTRVQHVFGARSGGVFGGCAGQGFVRQNVYMACPSRQQNPRHEGEASVLHRCPGHCRLRDLRGLIN